MIKLQHGSCGMEWCIQVWNHSLFVQDLQKQKLLIDQNPIITLVLFSFQHQQWSESSCYWAYWVDWLLHITMRLFWLTMLAKAHHKPSHHGNDDNHLGVQCHHKLKSCCWLPLLIVGIIYHAQFSKSSTTLWDQHGKVVLPSKSSLCNCFVVVGKVIVSLFFMEYDQVTTWILWYGVKYSRLKPFLVF